MGKITDTSVVTIKPMAYYKMLIHVLRFGNKFINPYQFKEVIGALIGRLEGENKIKDVVVEDAIPIKHGGSIEVAFSLEDYIPFEDLNIKFAEKNMFVVGWYHSHPGLKIFFSSVDVRNQLGWQSELNPSGIGIVFDHNYLENLGDLGFKTFRLDDPSKGPTSDYHEVKTIVEPPDSVEFYIKIIELIDAIHTKEPPILELNETPEFFSDISFPDQDQLKSKKPELNIPELLNSLKRAMSTFLDLSLQPLIDIVNVWSQDIIKKAFYNNTQMRKDLIALKDNLSKGINNLQKSFNFSLQERLKGLEDFIDDSLDTFDEDLDEFKNAIHKLNENLTQEIQQIFEGKLNPTLNQILTNLENNLLTLDEINEKNNSVLQNLGEDRIALENIFNILDPTKTRIKESLKKHQEKNMGIFKKKVSSIDATFSNLDKDLKKLFSDLKAAILVLEGSKDPVLNKINKLENEKKDLHNTIRDLKKEINELKKKE